MMPENTRKSIVFHRTVISFGSLTISRKFLNPTNFIACADAPVNEISVME